MNFKKNLLRLSGMIALCAAPALTFYQQGGPTTRTIFDFAADSSVAGHRKWNKATFNGSPGTKNFQLDLTTKASGAAQCYIVEFLGGQATGNPDLQIWNLGASLDDDGPGANRLPKARVWVTSSVNLTIAAFSNLHNNSDFNLITTQTTATTAAGCDDGVSPFYNQATNTTVRANTTVN